MQTVVLHQSNYARLVQLREESERLDNKIKDTIKLLADTRKALLATPATKFPKKVRDIEYTELLSYAKRISKFTVPPTFRELPRPHPRSVPASQGGLGDGKSNGTVGVTGEERVRQGEPNGEIEMTDTKGEPNVGVQA